MDVVSPPRTFRPGCNSARESMNSPWHVTHGLAVIQVIISNDRWVGELIQGVSILINHQSKEPPDVLWGKAPAMVPVKPPSSFDTAVLLTNRPVALPLGSSRAEHHRANPSDEERITAPPSSTPVPSWRLRSAHSKNWQYLPVVAIVLKEAHVPECPSVVLVPCNHSRCAAVAWSFAWAVLALSFPENLVIWAVSENLAIKAGARETIKHTLRKEVLDCLLASDLLVFIQKLLVKIFILLHVEITVEGGTGHVIQVHTSVEPVLLDLPFAHVLECGTDRPVLLGAAFGAASFVVAPFEDKRRPPIKIVEPVVRLLVARKSVSWAREQTGWTVLACILVKCSLRSGWSRFLLDKFSRDGFFAVLWGPLVGLESGHLFLVTSSVVA